MIWCKLRQIIDFAINDDPAVLRGGMFGHLCHGDFAVAHYQRPTLLTTL